MKQYNYEKGSMRILTKKFVVHGSKCSYLYIFKKFTKQERKQQLKLKTETEKKVVWKAQLNHSIAIA